MEKESNIKIYARDIDTRVTEIACGMFKDEVLKKEFLEKYKKEVKYFRDSIKKNILSSSHNSLDNSIYFLIKDFISENEKKIKFEKYCNFMELKGLDPVNKEEYFKVKKDNETGQSFMPSKYRRHSSPAVRSGIISRREKIYSESDSISWNWDHIFKEGFEEFDTVDLRVDNQYMKEINEFYDRKRGIKPKKDTSKKLGGLTPEGYLEFWVKVDGKWEKKIEYQTVEFRTVKKTPKKKKSSNS